MRMQGLTLVGLDRKIISSDTEKEFWHPPLEGYLKYNIDGASKGNSGIAGYGGVLRNAEGSIVFIFHCHLGTATNNMAELMAMEQCLDLLKQNNCLNVMIEANLELIINSVQKIHNGTVLDKVSKHWNLIRVFQIIQSHLQGLRTISFHHVRIKANKLVIFWPTKESATQRTMC